MAIIKDIETEYGVKSYWRLTSVTEHFDAEGESGVRGVVELKFHGYTNAADRLAGYRPAPVPRTVFLHDLAYKRDMSSRELYQIATLTCFPDGVSDDVEETEEFTETVSERLKILSSLKEANEKLSVALQEESAKVFQTAQKLSLLQDMFAKISEENSYLRAQLKEPQ